LLQFKINIVRSMSNYDLSILIPARNEMFLGRTIQDILENIEGKTEIIAVLDGYKPDPALPPDPRVTLIYNPEAKGQRAATNQAAKLSKAKYLMKCDAHCAFDKGFDTKMINDMYDNWTMVPLMKNLHAFDWICPDGHRRYQGPSGPCLECGKETTRDVVWIAKRSPNSRSYCFDSTPHFQYFGEYSKRPEGQGEITETMSLQGSCWMLTREKYWDLNVCDENFGSWGSQGIEVALKRGFPADVWPVIRKPGTPICLEPRAGILVFLILFPDVIRKRQKILHGIFFSITIGPNRFFL
jgi:glycosyltransferase involved in cell wall biosynthesis